NRRARRQEREGAQLLRSLEKATGPKRSEPVCRNAFPASPAFPGRPMQFGFSVSVAATFGSAISARKVSGATGRAILVRWRLACLCTERWNVRVVDAGPNHPIAD
ncbi:MULTISPECIES: hypothetical protein, partial [unclassified Methylobacterium]|uniref:hypothetical protein n=1 Tax=unclassified Methylobacterium TaxID=2615210 RepID=UPI00226A5AF5